MPEILPGAEAYLETFFDLSNDRQIGMTLGPIPAASIDRRAAGMNEDEADRFRRVLRALDGVYLAENRDKDGKGAAPGKIVGVVKPGLLQGKR